MEFRKHLFSSKYGLHAITPMKETTPSFWKKKGTLENRKFLFLNMKKIFKEKTTTVISRKEIKVIDVMKQIKWTRPANNVAEVRQLVTNLSKVPDLQQYMMFAYHYTHFQFRLVLIEDLNPEPFKGFDPSHESLLDMIKERVKDLKHNDFNVKKLELKNEETKKFVQVFDTFLNTVVDTEYVWDFYGFLYGEDYWVKDPPMIGEMMDQIVRIENDILGYRNDATASKTETYAATLLVKGRDDPKTETYDKGSYQGNSTESREKIYKHGNECFNSFISDVIVQGVSYPGGKGLNLSYESVEDGNYEDVTTNILRKMHMLYELASLDDVYLNRETYLYLSLVLGAAVKVCVKNVYEDESMEAFDKSNPKQKIIIFKDQRRIGTFFTIINIYWLYQVNILKLLENEGLGYKFELLPKYAGLEYKLPPELKKILQTIKVRLKPFGYENDTAMKSTTLETLELFAVKIFSQDVKIKNLFMYVQASYINEFLNRHLTDKSKLFLEASIIMDVSRGSDFKNSREFNILVSTTKNETVSCNIYNSGSMKKKINSLKNFNNRRGKAPLQFQKMWTNNNWTRHVWFNKSYELVKLHGVVNGEKKCFYRFKKGNELMVMAEHMDYNPGSITTPLQPIEQIAATSIFHQFPLRRILNGYFEFEKGPISRGKGVGFANKFFCCVNNSQVDKTNSLLTYTGEIDLATFNNKFEINASGFGFNFPPLNEADHYIGDFGRNRANGWGALFLVNANNQINIKSNGLYRDNLVVDVLKKEKSEDTEGMDNNNNLPKNRKKLLF